MALHWMDSFTSAVNNQLPPGWLNCPYSGSYGFYATAKTGEGRNGGTGIATSGYANTIRPAAYNTADWPVPTWGPGGGTWTDTNSDGTHIAILGFWFKLAGSNLGTWDYDAVLPGIALRATNTDEDPRIIGYLRRTSSGQLAYYHYQLVGGASVAVEIGRSDRRGLGRYGVGSYVEMKLVMADSGSVEVRCNGETVINVTGWDSSYSYVYATSPTRIVKTYRFGSAVFRNGDRADATYAVVDDIYLADGKPGTNGANDDFLGDVRSYRLIPNGDVTQEFTPVPPGPSYPLLDDTTLNTSDYVDGLVTNVDRYDFTDPPTLTAAYGATQNVIFARSDTGSDLTLELLAKSGAAEDAIELVQPGTSWTHASATFEVDPNTASNWTDSGLSSANFGFRAKTP